MLKRQAPFGIRFVDNYYLFHLLCTDDMFILCDNYDEVKYSIFNSSKLAGYYNIKISIQKTKIMAFKGEAPVKLKIIFNNTALV